jgi:hypothetical protein
MVDDGYCWCCRADFWQSIRSGSVGNAGLLLLLDDWFFPRDFSARCFHDLCILYTSSWDSMSVGLTKGQRVQDFSDSLPPSLVRRTEHRPFIAASQQNDWQSIDATNVLFYVALKALTTINACPSAAVSSHLRLLSWAATDSVYPRGTIETVWIVDRHWHKNDDRELRGNHAIST